MTAPALGSPGTDRPTVRVLRGAPTDAEVAALVVALTAAGPAPRADPAVTAPSAWTTYHRGRQTGLRPGPGAWRGSLR